ncbi:type I secretion system permease/ATPase [Marinicauda salina]|uniref:type I secretion system permease/ATPase n=1 Tax=Marinicauda salina TaxID=2135793 RepID=UPI001304A791|nr:type I secretion system permease/ATPase [Marinicauda salina]
MSQATRSGRTDQTVLDNALRQARPGFIAVGVFSLFLNLLYLTVPLYMLQVFDRVLGSGSRETLLYLTLIALVALLVLGALDAVRANVLTRIGSWLHARSAQTILGATMKARMFRSSFAGQPLRDLQQVQNFCSGPTAGPFFDAPWVPVFIVFLWLLHPWLGLLGIAGAIVMFILALANEIATRKRLHEASESQAKAFDQAQRLSEQYETVHAMGMADALTRRWSVSASAAQSSGVAAAERGGWLAGLSRFVRLGLQVTVLGLGALLVLRGHLSGGAMIAGSIMLGRALSPVEQSIGAWRAFSGARESFGRLQTLLRNFAPGAEPMSLPEPRGQVQVENLFVRAPGTDRLILKNVSLSLNPGQALAVLGPSASGKTTLCRSICGVADPFRGSVRIDGAEHGKWPRSQLGRAIGYLPQEVELFPGTIRENIARMTDAPAEDVLAAARLAGVHEVVLALPDGYDTMIGPGQAQLSGGQRQRIGLARALFGDPKLVVLDEPAAHLDQSGELALARAIERIKRAGAAVVIVSHSRPALELVDNILVLKEGQVDVYDSAEKVLAVLDERRRFLIRRAAERTAAQKHADAAGRTSGPPPPPPGGRAE